MGEKENPLWKHHRKNVLQMWKTFGPAISLLEIYPRKIIKTYVKNLVPQGWPLLDQDLTKENLVNKL